MIDQSPESYRRAIERQGAFGRLFLDYRGCPRGAVGRIGPAGGEEISHEDLLVREALSQPVIVDVDGGCWIPVNADALCELVAALKKCNGEIRTLRSASGGDYRNGCLTGKEGPPGIVPHYSYIGPPGPIGIEGMRGSDFVEVRADKAGK